MKKKMADLSRRLIVSSIMIFIVGALVIFSHHPIARFAMIALASILTVVAIWEYAQMFKTKGIELSYRTMVIFALAIVLSYSIGLTLHFSLGWPLFCLFAAVVILFINHFNDISNALLRISAEFFGIIYISVPLSLLLGILFFCDQTDLVPCDGRWWILYLIAVTKITDVAAYFIGCIFGKRKLAPKLSPKKTVEGAIAGLFAAVGMSVLIAYLGQLYSNGGFELHIFEAFYLGTAIGILAEIGDLAESLFKRDALVKDSNVLPGLGGILDMLDSLLFTTPIVYFFLMLF